MMFTAGIGSLTSLHRFDVAGLPAFVDSRFGRAVESDDREIPFVRHSREPVSGLALGGSGAEVKVCAAVGIPRWFVARAERREGLAVGQSRAGIRIVERHRPED